MIQPDAGTPVDTVEFADSALQDCFDKLNVAYVEEVQVLNCLSAGIQNLNGIEVLSELLQIDLTGNTELGDLEPLTRLPALVTLQLWESDIQSSDLEAISQIKTLRRLELLGNNLGDISALGQMVDLELLGLDSAGVTAGVAELSALKAATVITLLNNPGYPCAELELLKQSLPNASISPANPEVGKDCSP